MENNLNQPDCFMPNYNDEDAIAFNDGGNDVMYKVGKVKQAVRQAFGIGTKVPDAFSEFLKYKDVTIDTGGKVNEHRNYVNNNYMWFGDGINCEILKLGAKSWQKGKLRVKVTLEFSPDEPEIEETPPNEQPEISKPESPLDDLRQLINQNNHKTNE